MGGLIADGLKFTVRSKVVKNLSSLAWKKNMSGDCWYKFSRFYRRFPVETRSLKVSENNINFFVIGMFS